MVSQGREARVFAVFQLVKSSTDPAACSGAVLTASLSVNSLSDVAIATFMASMGCCCRCFCLGREIPGETFEGKRTSVFLLQTQKEETFRPWKQNDNIFYLCSPFYSKRILICSSCEPGQGFYPSLQNLQARKLGNRGGRTMTNTRGKWGWNVNSLEFQAKGH